MCKWIFTYSCKVDIQHFHASELLRSQTTSAQTYLALSWRCCRTRTLLALNVVDQILVCLNLLSIFQSGIIHFGVWVSYKEVSCQMRWLDIPQRGAPAGKGQPFERMAIMFVSLYDDVSLQPGST